MTFTCFFQQTYGLGKSLSRNIDNKPQSEIDFEEMKIINLTFLTLIGTQWYYESLLPPPMPLTEDATKEDSIKHQNEIKRINEQNRNRKFNTERLVVLFKDSLIAYPKSERNTKLLEPKSFVVNFPVDSSYIPLVKKLYYINESKSIDLDDITKKGRYELFPFSEIGKVQNDYKNVGKVRYSQIAFDENMNRACFYFDFLHGPKFGYGVIVFLEKKQGEWIIIGQKEIWIA
jgi:hypothetical protein